MKDKPTFPEQAEATKLQSQGISLDFMAGYYDKLMPTEKSSFRIKQTELVELKKGEDVLDVGCGPGILSVLSKMAVGESGHVSGIDIAPKMIDVAIEKARKYELDIDFKTASITELPYPDEKFDVVISSLMLHHLPVPVKEKGLKEIQRVLKKNGRFFLTDFGPPHFLTAPLMFLLFVWIRPTRYQLFGKLPELIKRSGFKDIKRLKKGLFLSYYIIKKE